MAVNYLDLHIHSKYARACSKNINLENLEKNARIKGLNVIGTGDFQHPKWNREIKENLVPQDSTGILRSKTDFPFICTSEISLMYTQGGKGRRIHFLLFAPSLDVVDQITDRLLKKGRIDYDGRPIFGFSAIELVDMMASISPEIEIVPAHCLVPDEKVLCNPELKKISNVTVGDRVLTHKGVYKKVTKTFMRPYGGKVYKITPYYFSEGITVTGEHPFLAIKTIKNCSYISALCKPNSSSRTHKCQKEHFKQYKPDWIQARNLQVNDVILYPRIQKIEDTNEIRISDCIEMAPYRIKGQSILPKTGRQDKHIKNLIKITPEFCRLVGYYLAEGWVTPRKNLIGFSFGPKENNYIEDVIGLMKSAFGINIAKKRSRNGFDLMFYSKILVDLFGRIFYEDGPKRAFSKKMPDWILYLPTDKQAELLRGWWRGDTGISTSEILSTQIKLICLRLGIIPSISRVTKETLNAYNKRIGHRKIIASHDNLCFRNLSFYEDRHNLLEDPVFEKFKTKSDRRHGWIDNEYAYIPVKSMKEEDYFGPVYNLEVEDDNSFVTPSATVHNCMTPWFGIFGEKSGFDSLKECFQEKTKNIHAVETGLSADPAMLSRLEFLDDINLVSFSDMHSFYPWKIGREATVMDLKEVTYPNILNCIRTVNGLKGTVEFFPEGGKYHVDGHRLCGISLDPKESKKINEICPNCKRKLTVGVLSRVEELAERPEGFKLKNRPNFRSTIPLSEIISFSLGSVNPASRNVWEIYNKLIQAFGSEFNAVFDAKLEALEKIVDKKIAKNILDTREGKVKILPGFDGVYGIPVFSPEDEEKLNAARLKVAITQMPEKKGKKPVEEKKQKSLADFK